jgi:hypothetical protein
MWFALEDATEENDCSVAPPFHCAVFNWLM